MQIRLPHVALVGVLALTVTGVATAAIPSLNGEVKSCYTTSTGALRVIDGEAGAKCKTTEKALNFNQKGPAGPKGATGATGAKGATGPQGPAGPSFARANYKGGTWHQVGTSYATLAEVDLPKGMHTIQGKLTTGQGEVPLIEAWARVTCRIIQRSAGGAETLIDYTQAEVGDNANEFAALSMIGVAYVPEGTDKAFLQCKDDGGPGGEYNNLAHIKLIAQQVGGYSLKTS